MSCRALVVGGGPAGLGAALGLAAWCDRVTVVEARPPDRRRAVGEHLPPGAVRELTRLGLGDLLDDPAHDPSPGVRSSWGDDAVVDKEYFMGLPGRGLNLRRDRFDSALARRAEAHGVRLRFGTRLGGLRREVHGWLATVDQDAGGGRVEEVAADVVVDASGRRAVAARALGAEPRRFDGLVGLVGRVEACPPLDEPGRIMVEAVAAGWWYGVLLSDGALLATLMTDPHVIRTHPGRVRGLWSESLAASRLLGPVARTGRWTGGVDAFDAAAQAGDPADPGPGFLAVGDAAAAWDPLSSWGITKGLRDGFLGAAALAEAHAGNGGAVEAHRRRRRMEFAAHLARRASFYGSETRWTAAPFWRARHAADTPTVPAPEA